ncbi:MAG TPA: LemA family protein [Gemmatimonadaceae bacterium]|nr:LemA family protein [Gemmatimonadaceae bacterium]
MGILLAVIAVFGVAGVSMYNSLVRRRNMVDQSYATIDVQLTQRYDLIPKLVETVKQYMTHERSLLEEIVRLRSRAVQSTTPGDRIRADNELSGALSRLNVTMENYPQLRSSENFVQLQRSLNEVEEQLAAARRTYNAAVTDYNNAVQTFPSSMIAGSTGFGLRQMFAADSQKRGDVDMKGLFKA